MRIIDQIHERSAFTPTEREIATFLEENSKEATNLSLDELSERIFVSKSTVIRFCKKLGFKGHKELCVELAKELSTYLMDDRRIDASFPYKLGDDKKMLADKVYALNYGALVQTYQDLDLDQLYRMAKTMHEKKAIRVYSFDDNVNVVQAFTDAMREIGANINLCPFSSMSIQQAASQTPDSVALFVTYHTREASAIQSAKILSGRKVPLFVITGPFKGMLSTYAQEKVSASIYEGEPKSVSISSRNAICLILDILYSYYYSFDIEKHERSIQERYDLSKGIIEGNH
jgi:DNA-binding MurR/RpiR family transcriptional regulator